MRSLTIAFLALSTLLAGCAGSKTDAPTESDGAFVSETVIFSRAPVLPLVIKTKPDSQVYQDKMWAIKIIEILADGEPVIGQPTLILYITMNTRPQTARSDHFVYKAQFNHMVFGDLQPDGPGGLIKYSIPEDARALEIRYRFVYYDNTPDERMHILKAYRAG